MHSELEAYIHKATDIVVFTGAGISTDSGISDYRSQGGLYEKFQPVTIQEFLSSEDSRKEFWRRKKFFYEQLENAKPNAAHFKIAQLEKDGKVKAVITQNIDGLHQMAGSENVIEIHGTNHEIICLECEKITSPKEVIQELQSGIDTPLCKTCEGLLKTNTISFGQNLNEETLQKSFQLAKNCDLLIAIGSSLVVEPAASIPVIAKKYGAKLIIINKDSTPLYLHADINIGENIEKVFSD